jgi:phosphoglycerate dehydrogenase-like enzyme
VSEITPDIMANYDGLYVNSPKVTAASVSRADCRVRIVARHGVGYDNVDVKALAAKGVITTNTPVAVRRPVAVARPHLYFCFGWSLGHQRPTHPAKPLERKNQPHGIRL